VVSCKYGNKPSVIVQSGEFLDKLTDYQFLRDNSAPWGFKGQYVQFRASRTFMTISPSHCTTCYHKRGARDRLMEV
jgi:hypothetical protein